MSTVDTRCMSFTEHGDYIRIFRVAHTKPINQSISHQNHRNSLSSSPLSLPINLQTKIFIPLKKSDTIVDIKQKLSDWVNQAICK